MRFETSSDEGRTMALLINQRDWSKHPLGEIETWPQSLRNFLSTMLASRFPMYLAWGEAGYSFYNDGYIPILTDKHPAAIGATFEKVWGELTPDIRALIAGTRDDHTSYFEDAPVTLLKNGRVTPCYFTFSYSGVRGDSGKIEGFYAVALETTDAYLAKQQRIAEGERLRALFHQAPGFMAVMSGPAHVFEIVNDAYRAVVGTVRELIGKPVREAIPEAAEQGFVALLDQVYASGHPFVGRESRFVVAREAGQPPLEIYIDFIYQPVVNAQGQVMGIMVQGHEVTEAFFARQALVAADRQKDQFIATLAHELRNPLAPIRAASTLLQLPNVTTERLERTTAVISRQVNHMAKLLDDLLDVARISNNQIRLVRETVSVENIIAMAIETAKPMIEKKHQQIIVRHDEPISLYGDPVRLTQAISNLVFNAAKYTDDDGHIIVSTWREGDQCRISVKDNGIGIDAQSLATVFDMFAQEHDVLDRSDGGLGIGLGLVKGLVNLHSGTVFAESEGRGRGSTFTVSLPCPAPGAVPDAKKPDMSAIAPARRLKILVADDNVDLVELVIDFLEILGHETIRAHDGATAYALAIQERPDVAIVDIGMPGMNGYELVRALRTEDWGRKMALIAATGFGNEDDHKRTTAAGFDMHLTKPFDIARLRDALHALKA